MGEISRVYQMIASRGTPCKLPGSWSHLRSCPDFFHVEDPNALLTALRENFTDGDLIESGAAKQADDGNVILAPALADPQAIIFALRETAKSAPFDLWGADGVSVGGLFWQPLAALSHYRARPFLESSYHQLFVAFSMADLQVLWSLGFAATVPVGLADLSGNATDVLLTIFGISRQTWKPFPGIVQNADASNALSSDDYNCLSFTFASWSPSLFELTEPPLLRDIRDHARLLEKHLRVKCDIFNCWTPTTEELESIQFCVHAGGPAHICKALIESAGESIDKLIPFELWSASEASATSDTQQAAPVSYGDAVEAWLEIAVKDGGGDQQKVAWLQVMMKQQAELIGPWQNQAAEIKDLVDRNTHNVLAQSFANLHPQLLLMTAKTLSAVYERGKAAPLALPAAELDSLFALLDRTRAMTQEVQPWRKKSKLSLAKLKISKTIQ